MPEAIYIASEFIWNTREPDTQPGLWQVPRADIGLGMLDLRTLPQMASPGILNGPCFVVLSERDKKVGEYLGSWKESFGDGDETRLAVSRMLGIDKIPSTIDNPMALLLYLLTREADPTGQERWKPLRVGRRRQLKLSIAGQEYTERVDEAHPAFTNTIKVFQTDYRRNKVEGVPAEVLQKWTGSEVLKLYGRLGAALAERILPPEFSADGLKLPETVILESFNQGDSTTLGPDLSWTEVRENWSTVSNEVTHTAGANVRTSARAESALSSDDHYAQLIITALDVVLKDTDLGVAARFDAAAETYYTGLANGYSTPNVRLRINKIVAGTNTNLVGPYYGIALSLPDTLKLEVSTNSQILYLDGVQRLSGPDTAITGNLYTGLAGWTGNGAGNIVKGITFEAGDLGAAGPPAGSLALLGVGI